MSSVVLCWQSYRQAVRDLEGRGDGRKAPSGKHLLPLDKHRWHQSPLPGQVVYFHPEMIAITPTDKDRLVGRESCVAAWRRFTEAATSLRWRETDPLVRVCGDAAVVAYNYELACEMDGRWLAVADQFSGIPGSELPG